LGQTVQCRIKLHQLVDRKRPPTSPTFLT
jgi:hypothetical protein